MESRKMESRGPKAKNAELTEATSWSGAGGGFRLPRLDRSHDGAAAADFDCPRLDRSHAHGHYTPLCGVFFVIENTFFGQ